MTAQLAIIGSQCAGHCTGHSGGRNWTGVISTTPQSIGTAGGTALALIGSTGVADCGHTFTVIDGSTIATEAGVGLAIVGSHCPTSPGGSTGVITTGYAYGTTA
jgi:hypothetical protein